MSDAGNDGYEFGPFRVDKGEAPLLRADRSFRSRRRPSIPYWCSSNMPDSSSKRRIDERGMARRRRRRKQSHAKISALRKALGEKREAPQ